MSIVRFSGVAALMRRRVLPSRHAGHIRRPREPAGPRATARTASTAVACAWSLGPKVQLQLAAPVADGWHDLLLQEADQAPMQVLHWSRWEPASGAAPADLTLAEFFPNNTAPDAATRCRPED